jgi:glycosyltransferase involved in cell wall biosynthesis
MKTPDPVYILIRTSNRPVFFKVCMESIKAQTYPNIITIVHTDNPADNYVEGDIIIRGKLNKQLGNGYYNLYNNALLAAIPDGPGWYHFIDDDDMYYDADAIKKLVANSKRTHINVARVRRWGNTIFPKRWGNQRSYQTECFFLHTDHKNMAKWWNKRGGDHAYSKQITAKLSINWIENLIICKAQAGKGHGRRLDLYQQQELAKLRPRSRVSTVGARNRNKKLIYVKFIRRNKGRQVQAGKIGEKKYIPEHYAKQLLKLKKIEILEKNNIFEGKK